VFHTSILGGLELFWGGQANQASPWRRDWRNLLSVTVAKINNARVLFLFQTRKWTSYDRS